MSDLEKRITAKMILDDSGYANTLKGINSELKNNQSEIKVARSGLEAFGRTTENMSRVQTSLQRQLELQNKKLDTYKNSLQKATDILAKNINKRDELTRSLSKAEKAHQEAIEKYGKESKEAKETGDALEKLKQEHEKLNQTVENNAKSIQNYETQMNKAEGEVNKAQTAVNKFNRELENTSGFRNAGQQLEHIGNNFQTVGDKAQAIGGTLTSHVSLPLSGIAMAAGHVGMEFESNMSRVQAISGATGEDFKKLENQALNLGESTAYSANECAQGMENLASSGFTVKETMQAMPGLLDLAASSGEDLALSSDIAASTLRGFNIEAGQAGHVADVLAKNASDTNAAVADTGEAMKYIAPVANSMGQSLEEVTASIGIMADAGIKGSQAGTTLRGALSRLANPSNKAAGAMESLGFKAFDAQGKMLPLNQVIGNLQESTKGLTDEQKQSAIATIFGQEAMSGMLVLMEAGPDKINELTNSLKNSDGAAKDMAETMQNNTKASIEEAMGALETAGIKTLKAAAPAIKSVAEDIGALAEKFSNLSPETQEFIVKMGMAAIAAGPVTSAVGGVSKGIGGLAKAAGKIKSLKTAKNFSDFTRILLGTADATGEVATGLTGTGAAAETAGTGIEHAVGTASEFKEKATGALESVKGGIEKVKALKGAKTFGDFTKVLLGTATATGEVGAGLTGAGAAAGGLGTTLAGMALPIAGTVAAVAGIGYAGYKTAEYLNESATPSVDLFADKVEYSTNKIQSSHGALAAQVESNTIKISESTKKSVQSYLDMDKKASDSLMNIKINSDKFTKESKDAVIKNFTEMSKRSSNLSKEQQEIMTENFKKLVGDTGVLTKKNKDEIIKQYTNMVNGTKGLTKKQKEQTIKDFKDTLNQSVALTKKQSQDLQKLYNDMGNRIKTSLDKNKKTELKSQKDFFAKSNALTTKEEADILKKTEKHWNSKKSKIDGYQKQINGIIQRAANEHRQITDKEAKTIDDIQKKMKESAVKTLSDNEVEAKVILERMKDHDENITAEMASNHIKQLNKSRDKSVSTANDECDKRLAEIMRMRDESKVISADQADKLIADAKKQRDETINAAEETRDEAVKKIENMNKNITRDVDTTTGDVKSHWDKLKDWWNSWWPKPKTTTVTTKYITKGQKPGGNWTGNSHFQGGLTYLHERGYELYDLPSGTKIYNHESSEQMVLETARQTAQGVINSMLNNNSQSGGDTIIHVSIAGEEIDRIVVPRVLNNLALSTMRKRR